MNWIAAFRLFITMSCFSYSLSANAEVCVPDGEKNTICRENWEALARYLSSRLESWRLRGIRAIKKLDELNAESKKKEARISHAQTLLRLADSDCQKRILSERIKFGKTIGQPCNCKPPVELYVVIAVLGASVIGGSVGFYFLGKHL